MEGERETNDAVDVDVGCDSGDDLEDLLPLETAVPPPPGRPIDIVIWPRRLCELVFAELAASLKWAYEQRGRVATITDHVTPGHATLFLGVQPRVDDGRAVPSIPPDAFYYNTEQVADGQAWGSEAYQVLLGHFRGRLWDYHPENIAWLDQKGFGPVTYVPMGWAPTLEMSGEPGAETGGEAGEKGGEEKEEDENAADTIEDKPIDVLFYGCVAGSARRRSVLDAIERLPCRPNCAFFEELDVWGPDRAELIRSARICLNVHYYEMKRFEMARVSLWLANAAFVISEVSNDRALDTDWDGGVIFGLLEDLPALVGEWLGKTPAERDAVAKEGQRLFRAKPMNPPELA